MAASVSSHTFRTEYALQPSEGQCSTGIRIRLRREKLQKPVLSRTKGDSSSP